MKANTKYDPEFKLQAVKEVVDNNRSIREFETSLGITGGVLKGWVQKHRDQQKTAIVNQLSAEAELKQLRKENEQLRRECDILKKAAEWRQR
jgi:transposase